MDPVRNSILRSDGGIVSLASFVAEHDEAVEYDLLTRTGHELKDVGRSLSWGALASFILQRDEKSAISRDLDEDSALWATTTKTNGILADIFDMLAQINANIVAIGNKKEARDVPRYPRPGVNVEANNNVKKIGSGGLPPDELADWFEMKRRERHGRIRS